MTFPRYPAYKDSGVEWLGPIPSHWHPAPVKRLFEIVGGSTPASDDPTFWDGEIPWATPADLGNGPSLRLERTLRQITSAGLASCSTTMVPRGSIVLSTRAPIGSIAIASVPLCTNQGCKSLVPRGTSDARCFAYLLSIATAALNVRGRGATFLELSGEELGRFQLPSAPVDEQQAIADFLDRETAKIDALVAEQERLIELLQEKRQAVISHAVTKGLNLDVPMKDSGVEWIGEIPAHWELLRAKTVSTFTTSGPRGWSERIADEGALFVQSGDLNDRLEVAFATCKRVVVNDDAESARTRLHGGDVLVCITGAKTGNVGVCQDPPEPAYVNQHLCLVRPSSRVFPEFLATTLKSRVGQVHFALSQYGLKQGLSLEDVRECSLPVPPTGEQAAIVRGVTAATRRFDLLEAEAEQATALLQERRSALISAAVTGQIDVRGASAPLTH